MIGGIICWFWFIIGRFVVGFSGWNDGDVCSYLSKIANVQFNPAFRHMHGKYFRADRVERARRSRVHWHIRCRAGYTWGQYFHSCTLCLVDPCPSTKCLLRLCFGCIVRFVFLKYIPASTLSCPCGLRQNDGRSIKSRWRGGGALLRFLFEHCMCYKWYTCGLALSCSFGCNTCTKSQPGATVFCVVQVRT